MLPGQEPQGRGDRRTSVVAVLVTALLEAERWVLVSHQAGVPGDAEDPAVQAEDEIEELLGVAPGEQQHHPGDEHQDPDETRAPHDWFVGAATYGVPGAAEQETDDDVVRDGEQPPLDQDEPEGEVQVQRSTPTLNSKMLRGFLPVNRIAKNATTLRTKNAIHRNARTR